MTIPQINKTETVLLQKARFKSSFKIIPQTNLSEDRPGAIVHISLQRNLNYFIKFYFTSMENSPGDLHYFYKDGEPLEYTVDRDETCIA